MKEYYITGSESIRQIQDTVNQMLKDGWECHGGVSTTTVRVGTILFHQALTRKIIKEEENEQH